MIHLSNRSINTPPSPIRRLSHLAHQAVERGIETYHLNIGQPDLCCPPQFEEGLRLSEASYLPYAPSEGIPKFRRAWADWVNRTLGVQTKPEEYIVTMGASEGLVFLFTACCDPGDEIIVFDPTYANYMGFAAQSGVRLISLLSSLKDGFVIPDDEIIEKHVTSRTRAILFCNPNNPTGVTYDVTVVERLLNLCHRFGMILIMDETYRELVYDDVGVQTVLSLTTDDPHVVVVDSVSKRFSLCGSRIGTLFVPSEKLREKILHLAQARLSAPTLGQKAATHMLGLLQDSFIVDVRQIYQQRRDTLLSALEKVQGVESFRPTGAFYTLAKLPVEDAEDFATYLLRDFSYEGCTLFLAPARGFYSIPGVGQDEVRLAFVLEEHKLQRAIQILEAGLEAYRTR
ncbi:MAG: pyridoxal phosphate-dependent aminotransferase [Bdellovibrionales bacterium]|nr:pyridoxal phosphate-dependent aminotransferase [Bdellovibrionales bacterium]